MHFITIALISFLLCNFAVSITIISSNSVFDDTISHDFSESDMTVDYLSEDQSQYHILETIYAKQTFGKSHRFYFTLGVRQNEDKRLANIFKQTGWKLKTDAQVNLTFPDGDKTIKSLTYVKMTVFQDSTDNQINVIGGGINQTTITINIQTKQTSYVAYNVTFYGKE